MISLCCYLMSNVYSFLTRIFCLPPTTILSLLLISIVLSAICIILYESCVNKLCGCSSCTFELDFDYGFEKGPHKWKQMFPASRGYQQSPINIRTETTHIIGLSEPLVWTAYDEFPVNVKMCNNGHTVILRPEYADIKPTLSGRDLFERYSFVSLCFRWSVFDNEGSEHLLNNRRYPLELQATHLSVDNCLNPNESALTLILSYFFTITKHDNPHLDPIILHLNAIRKPNTSVEIPPFSLSWLCYRYKSSFYCYGGSLTEPPCTEGVMWFIQPEPMSISKSQLSKFRQLLSKNGTRIVQNSRPVQDLNSRSVFYNYFEELDDMEIAETC